MSEQVRHASIEDILHDICYYEDPDSSLLISTTEDGGVFISDQEWGCAVVEDTMKKALIKYQIHWWQKREYTKEQARQYAKESFGLDWSSAICRMEVEKEEE